MYYFATNKHTRERPILSLGNQYWQISPVSVLYHYRKNESIPAPIPHTHRVRVCVTKTIVLSSDCAVWWQWLSYSRYRLFTSASAIVSRCAMSLQLTLSLSLSLSHSLSLSWSLICVYLICVWESEHNNPLPSPYFPSHRADWPTNHLFFHTAYYAHLQLEFIYHRQVTTGMYQYRYSASKQAISIGIISISKLWYRSHLKAYLLMSFWFQTMICDK